MDYWKLVILMTITATGCVAQSFTMSDEAMLGQGQVSSVTSSNAQVIGALIWVEADFGVYKDAGVTPAANGDIIQQWNDKSGNNFNGVSADTAVYVTGQLNSKPIINFTNSSAVNWTNSSLTNLQAYVVYLVLEADNSISFSGFSPYKNPDGVSQVDWLKNGATATATVNAGVTTVTGSVTASNYFLLTAVYNGINSSLQVNGVTMASGNSGPNPLTGPQLGDHGFTLCKMAAFIICTNTLGLTNTTFYLTNKYNLH